VGSRFHLPSPEKQRLALGARWQVLRALPDPLGLVGQPFFQRKGVFDLPSHSRSPLRLVRRSNAVGVQPVPRSRIRWGGLPRMPDLIKRTTHGTLRLPVTVQGPAGISIAPARVTAAALIIPLPCG
jgi:hypothetical protein